MNQRQKAVWAITGACLAALLLGCTIKALAVVPSATETVVATCDGSTTTFSFTFGVFATSQVRVVLVGSDDAETPLTETTHYTVALPNNDGFLLPGGTITTTTAYASGYTLHISRRPDLTQESGYSTASSLDLETMEDDFDKTVLRDQYLQRQITRSLRAPETDTTDFNLPVASLRASSMIYFDANGEPTMVSGLISPNDVTVSNFWNLTLDDANWPDSLVSLGLTGTLRDLLLLSGPNDYEVQQTIGGDAELDVRWFGATGDGVTDDSNAIQDAIDTANDLGGATIRFAAGTYVADALTLCGNLRLAGTTGATLQMKASATDDLLTISSVNDVTIEGLTIDMNGANQGDPNYPVTKCGLYATGAVGVAVRNCVFENLFEVGVNIYQCESVWIEGCRFGGDVEGSPTAWMVDDVHVQTATALTIRDCVFDHDQPADANDGVVGIFLAGVVGADLIGNHLTGCGRDTAGSHQGAAIDLYISCQRVTIAYNVLDECNYYGVRVSRSSDIRIVGNDIEADDNVEDGQAIQILADATYDTDRIWVVGNTLVGANVADGRGVYIVGNDAAGDEPNDLFISHNRITAYYGVYAYSGALRLHVTDNDIESAYPAIRLDQGSSAVLGHAVVTGNRCMMGGNTTTYAIRVSGSDCLVAHNEIVDAYRGIDCYLTGASRVLENTIEASDTHLRYYNEAQDLWSERNLCVGDGNETYRQGSEVVHHLPLQPAGLRWVARTFDVNAADTTGSDDQFDNTAANANEQVLTWANALPAYAELVSVQFRCTETVTGSTSMSTDIGTSSGGNEVLSAANTDSANDINPTPAAGAPELGATNAARSIYVNATPGANWNTLTEGRWVLIVTYLDYAALWTWKANE